ncbi:MAG: Ig-like domain-containing protein [Lachnospiraceae bacterium]|nr:Ig-like domain-containing protein [Lachnospiraceae bacterium]
MEFINIDAPEGVDSKNVKQNLKFKTGKFVWRIKFSAPLDPATVNNTNLYVTTRDGERLKTAIHYNSDTHEIEIEPLEAYVKDGSYDLNVTKNVKSVGGQALKAAVKVPFTV